MNQTEKAAMRLWLTWMSTDLGIAIREANGCGKTPKGHMEHCMLAVHGWITQFVVHVNLLHVNVKAYFGYEGDMASRSRVFQARTDLFATNYT